MKKGEKIKTVDKFAKFYSLRGKSPNSLAAQTAEISFRFIHKILNAIYPRPKNNKQKLIISILCIKSRYLKNEKSSRILIRDDSCFLWIIYVTKVYTSK